MAKVDSILKISGTLADITYVVSKTYGAHARAKRGTYTPVTLAEGMQKSAEVQKEVNQIAKVVFDKVNEFVPGFKDGKFWSGLLSIFRKQQKAGRPYSYADLDLIEMRSTYPTSKHGHFWIEGSRQKIAQLHYQLAVKGKCRIKLFRMASDETLLRSYPTEVLEFLLHDQYEPAGVSIVLSDLPTHANVLWVLHCEVLLDGVETGLLKNQGVKFFA